MSCGYVGCTGQAVRQSGMQTKASNQAKHTNGKMRGQADRQKDQKEIPNRAHQFKSGGQADRPAVGKW